MIESAAVDSFGNTTVSSRTRYGYTGRELDSEAGVIYYRSRFYDSQAGRFLGEDPIGFRGGDLNLYAYVKNQPVQNVDPLGMEILSARQYEMHVIPPQPPPPTIDYRAFFFGDGGVFTRSTAVELISAKERARQPCKPFGTRFVEGFVETNAALPGVGAPTGFGLITGGKVAEISGESGIFGLVLNGLYPPSAVPGALIRSGGNKLAVTAAFEGGVAIGSYVQAATCPCGY